MTPAVLSVRNPRTGEWDYQIPVTPAEDIQRLTDSLRDEQVGWRALGADGRANCLNRFAEQMMAELEPLGQALAVDTGRTTFAQFEAVKSIELIRRQIQLHLNK